MQIAPRLSYHTLLDLRQTPPIIVVPIDIEIALVLLVHTYPRVPFKGNGRFQPVPSSELRPLARSFP
jgi:hypothetical protein